MSIENKRPVMAMDFTADELISIGRLTRRAVVRLDYERTKKPFQSLSGVNVTELRYHRLSAVLARIESALAARGLSLNDHAGQRRG